MIRRRGKLDWWPAVAPDTPLLEAATMGLPKRFLRIAPNTSATIAVVSRWVTYKMEAEGRLYDRAAACVYLRNALFTYSIGPSLFRQFMEVSTWQRWVTVWREGDGPRTRYRLAGGDKVNAKTWALAEQAARRTEWIPFDEWPEIQHLRRN